MAKRKKKKHVKKAKPNYDQQNRMWEEWEKYDDEVFEKMFEEWEKKKEKGE